MQHADPAPWIADRLAESDVFAVETHDALIGILLLSQHDVTRIGYLLAENVWGKGYASELLLGLTRASPRPVYLRAGVEANDPASARVLEKAGFTRQAHSDTPDMATYHLGLT